MAQVLLLSGTNFEGVGNQFSAAILLQLCFIFGAVFATPRYSLCGCSGAVFCCNSGASFGAFLVQFLLLSGTYLAEVGGQFSAAPRCNFCCISGAVFIAFRY